MELVRTKVHPEGFNIGINQGVAAGQTVEHMHVHIIPRYEGQPLMGHGKAGMADMDELTALAKQISRYGRIESGGMVVMLALMVAMHAGY